MPEQSKPPAKSPAKPPEQPEEVRFIGVSAKEFLHYAAEERKVGSFAEKTRIDPKIRDSYSQFVDALSTTDEFSVQYYVFVFSKFIIIKIKFDF